MVGTLLVLDNTFKKIEDLSSLRIFCDLHFQWIYFISFSPAIRYEILYMNYWKFKNIITQINKFKTKKIDKNYLIIKINYAV